MIRASQFSLASVQIAIWLPDTPAFSQARFLRAILEPYESRYDGDLQAIPFPADAPPDLPRLVLQSKDTKWKLQAAVSRLDSFWNLLPNETTHGNDGRDIANQCTEALTSYMHASNVVATRAAVVLQRFCPIDQPAQVLIDRFCTNEAKEGPLRNSQTFELHNHKRYHLKSLNVEINSWVRCRTATITESEAPAIMVEQDMNTTQEQGAIHFDADRVAAFVQDALTEANAVLSIYFPEGD